MATNPRSPTMAVLNPPPTSRSSPDMDSAVTFHLAATPADLTAFAGTLRGSLVRPGDATYESERQVFNTALQGAPVAIARVADAADVATTVAYACRNGIEIA